MNRWQSSSDVPISVTRSARNRPCNDCGLWRSSVGYNNRCYNRGPCAGALPAIYRALPHVPQLDFQQFSVLSSLSAVQSLPATVRGCLSKHCQFCDSIYCNSVAETCRPTGLYLASVVVLFVDSTSTFCSTEAYMNGENCQDTNAQSDNASHSSELTLK